jgi:hypothetical protein
MAVDHKQKQELNSGVGKAKRVWRVWLLGDLATASKSHLGIEYWNIGRTFTPRLIIERHRTTHELAHPLP